MTSKRNSFHIQITLARNTTLILPWKGEVYFFKVSSYSNIRIYLDIWIFPIEPEVFAWTLLRALHIWILSVLCVCVCAPVYFLMFVNRKYCIYMSLKFSQNSLPTVSGTCIILEWTISRQTQRTYCHSDPLVCVNKLFKVNVSALRCHFLKTQAFRVVDVLMSEWIDF